MALPPGPLVLVDGHNMFIRNYVRSPYMDSNGQRAGGTTGMVVSVRKVINDFRPSNLLVVWDGEGGSQRRRSIYSSYKEGRKVRLNEEYDFGETPEERLDNMRHQRNHASELLSLLGVPQVRADAVEADDLIAYVAGKMDHPHGVIIVSTDQDFLQLIRSSGTNHMNGCEGGHPVKGIGLLCDCPEQSEVKVYSPVKKRMYDRETFISEFGVLPENFRLVKALAGDGSDNIEGVKGFGFKTISKSFPFLRERMVTADDVLNSGLEGVLGKRLEEQKSRFLENLTLVDLSEPMLSATAARLAREALTRDVGCKEVDFRMRVVRDGISFQGTDFIGAFRDFVMRRRKMMGDRLQRAFDATPEELGAAAVEEAKKSDE
jgi:DNA polymerase-1